MFGLQDGCRAGVGRTPMRLLAEVAPYRRPGGADRLAQRLRRDVPIALLDRNRVGLDDEVGGFVGFGARERGGGRGFVRPHRGAVEVLAPAFVRLKNDNAIREAAGGDDVGHSDLSRGASIRPHIRSLADFTTTLYD